MIARAAAWALAPLMFAAMVGLHATGPQTYFMGDFRAFYCGASALAHGADPYREEPLKSCENAAGPPAQPVFLRSVAVPAPLPPHALLAFVPFSALPFPLAAGIYLALLMAAMSASVVLFARVIPGSSLALNLAFAAITATVTYYVGQPIPFVLLALGGAALFARKAQFSAASACAVAATIEPHVALPVLLAMLVILPRSRLPIVAFGSVAALAGIAAGWPLTLEYVREVVPAHALANAYEWQFSLTSLLTSLGVAAPPAIRLGEAMFALTTFVGIVVAGRMLQLAGDRAVVVLLPPAFALFGGVHVHFQQIAVAFPAIMYVIALYPQARAFGVTGLALAMLPWNVLGASPLAGLAPALAGTFGALMLGRRAGLLLGSAAALIVLSLLGLAYAGLGPAEVHFATRAFPADGLAEKSWGEFSHAALMRPSIMMQWLRIPTLLGLAFGLLAIVRAAYLRPSPLPGATRRRATGAVQCV